MTRLLLAPLFVLLIALSILPVQAQTANLQGRRVALDPGHGETATEVGATNTVNGTTLLERDVNWDVVAATKTKLESMGALVLVTRAQNEWVDRPTRYHRANSFGAEVLVSVHHNGSSDPSVNYTTSFFTQPSDKPVALLAQSHLVRELGFADGGIRRNAFGMTVRPKMPSTLTEAWFLTNDQLAERWLQHKSSLLEPESRALADGIAEYLTTTSSTRR